MLTFELHETVRLLDGLTEARLYRQICHKESVVKS